jgi:leucyl/phenylalanyl-tRNA--protein transferase
LHQPDRQRPSEPTIIEPEFLLAAYASGYFPMANSTDGTIRWFSPDPRGIIPLTSFNVARSLRQAIKQHRFDVRWNTAFEEVIRACGSRPETWISEDIVQTYMEMHRLGFAHSVECWRDGTLAGGLYGVALGGAFFGESMFSRARDASKVALVYLVERLNERRFALLDTQYRTPHLAHFGAIEIPRREYLALLRVAIRKQRSLAG